MPRLIARLLFVLLVLLSSGVMPVPTRWGKARSCCAVKSSCAVMRADAGEESCCRLRSGASHTEQAAQPSGACVLAAMGCGPASAHAPSAPIVFQFIVPAGPVYRVADAWPLGRLALDVASVDAERDLRPRPPRPIVAPEYRA